MEIRASELRNGVEVDLPVDWSTHPATQDTIKYNSEIKRYVIADIKTGAVHSMSANLSDIVSEANRRYEHINNTALED